MIFVKLEGPQTSKNRVVEWLGGVLGGSWGNLGASWVLLEPFWASWRDLWGILGHVGRVMEPLRDVFGGSWEGLGRFLGGLGGFQRPSGKHFLRIFWFLKQFLKFVKNLGKPLVFH